MNFNNSIWTCVGWTVWPTDASEFIRINKICSEKSLFKQAFSLFLWSIIGHWILFDWYSWGWVCFWKSLKSFRIFLVPQFLVHFFVVCRAFITNLEIACFSLIPLPFVKRNWKWLNSIRNSKRNVRICSTSGWC